MNHRIFVVTSFLLTVLVFNSFSQKLKTGQILNLTNHPENKSLFIANIYNNNGHLIEKWEMSTIKKGIKTTNYNDFLDSGIIFPNGKHFSYDDKLVTLLEENYSMGLREGYLKVNYPSGKHKLTCLFSKNILNGSLLSHYENGVENLNAFFVNGDRTPKETKFYEDGKIHYRIKQINAPLERRTEVYYPNGKLKREIHTRGISMKEEKCYDGNGHITNCKPLWSELNYTDGVDLFFNAIDNFELPEKIVTNDTISPTLAISINHSGKVEDIYVETDSDTAVANYLVNWAKKLNHFSPPALDNFSWNSLLKIEFMFINGKHVQNILPVFLRNYSINNKSFELEEIYSYSYKDAFYLDTTKEIISPFIADEMPEFPGGENELKLFITKNFNYPEGAQKFGSQEKVFVRFTIDEEGKAINPQIIGNTDPLLDAAVLRIVKIMPKWKPGKQKGKPIKVSLMFPIVFL